MKASKLISIAWIRSNRNILHHQYIIATVRYKPFLQKFPAVSYDIKFERLGRMTGSVAKAKQAITIRPAAPLSEELKDNDLILALVEDGNPVISYVDRLIPSPNTPRWQYVYERPFGFADSPATLGELACYSTVVVEHAPEYHLSSTNCYFYARLMMHIIVERHLAFDCIVSPDVLERSSQARMRGSSHPSSQSENTVGARNDSALGEYWPPFLISRPPPPKSPSLPPLPLSHRWSLRGGWALLRNSMLR